MMHGATLQIEKTGERKGEIMKMECNFCQTEFDVTPLSFEVTRKSDLEIRYFVCPSCGHKYVFYAADSAMQTLTDRRIELERKVRISHLKKFREKTIREYLKEIDRLKVRQEEILPDLKKKAEKLLNEDSTHK